MPSANDDDIPDGIPEEDREEFKRLRARKWAGFQNDGADFLQNFMHTESLTAVWRASILTGQTMLVEAALKDDFTPDTPLDDEGRPPLVSIARTIPKNPEEATGLADVARLLIDRGAILNLRDRCGLLPADHALFSPVPAVAREIVLGTLRHNSQRRAEHYFRPNYKAIFAIIPNASVAAAARTNLIRNIETVKNSIHDAIAEGNWLLHDLPVHELHYWDNLKIPELRDLPLPADELRKAYLRVENHKESRNQGNTKITRNDIEAAEDHARMLETQYCHQFKPDYT